MFWNKALGAALVLLSVLALAACGGTAASEDAEVASLGGSSTETETTTTTTTSDDPQEILLDFTECMRDEGIDLPDPDFSGGGGGGGRIVIGPGGVDPDDPDFRAAQEKCAPMLEGLNRNFDADDRQAFQDAALEFAKCMREHGIDMPDPDFSAGVPGRRGPGGAFRQGGIDPDDPDFQEAREACDEAFADLPGRLGRGPAAGGSDDE